MSSSPISLLNPYVESTLQPGVLSILAVSHTRAHATDGLAGRVPVSALVATVAELINSKFPNITFQWTVHEKGEVTFWGWNFSYVHTYTPCTGWLYPPKYQRRGLVQKKIKKISGGRAYLSLSQIWQWLWVDYQTHKNHNSTVSLFVVIWMW